MACFSLVSRTAFLGVVQAAHLSFVDGQQLDALAAPRLLSQLAAVVIRLKRGCQRGFI